MPAKTLWWEDGKLKLIDQSRLPEKLEIVECGTVEQAAAAISTMQVRGAPAIGCAAAFGMALARISGTGLQQAAEILKSTRPTAVNLS